MGGGGDQSQRTGDLRPPICDHNLKFMWIKMKWPAATSDYMAWVTSSLAINLENNVVKLIEGGMLVGDCAYVKKSYMATPLKGFLGGYKDAYNFYLSQLRITVELLVSLFIDGQFYALHLFVQLQKYRRWSYHWYVCIIFASIRESMVAWMLWLRIALIY
jgi:hypothetical protein